MGPNEAARPGEGDLACERIQEGEEGVEGEYEGSGIWVIQDNGTG